MRIVLRPHLKTRLGERKIPNGYPGLIITSPVARFKDALSCRNIAIGRMRYGGKIRPFMVAYDIIGEEIQVTTIHPISEQEIKNKAKRGRWTKYEKS